VPVANPLVTSALGLAFWLGAARLFTAAELGLGWVALTIVVLDRKSVV